MIVLAFDTSAAHVAVALMRDAQVLKAQREEMSRGQTERLMVLLDQMLAEQNSTWQQLDAIGVGIGPGNFTGIRVSVSAARGLALGLGIPAIGVTRFDVIKAMNGETGIPSIATPQNKVYVEETSGAPRLIERSQAEGLGRPLQFDPEGFNPAPLIAKIAARRINDPHSRPAPLYIKSADAAPARDAPPRIIP